MPDDAADTALLTAQLRVAGGIARKYFTGTYRTWDKGEGSPVTEADIAIDRFLKRGLLAARPDYGWLSEETEDGPERLSRSSVFVVDPIDGTYGFVKGRPHFTIVAAVVRDGQPVAAAIYNPIAEEMFSATAGGGAVLNGTPISVSLQTSIEHCAMLGDRRVFEDSRWPIPWPPTMTIASRSSIAYRMALVAAGRFDAMISLSPKHEWDVAAGDLIVREAGGRVAARDGGALTYNKPVPTLRGIVCAGALLQEPLLARLRHIQSS